ncbi:MAG: hypothetical protein ACE5O2_07835 [Armatimonadota bacterium]
MPKSAYEAALERLKDQGLEDDLPKLSPAQKKKISEITKQYEAKIAEAKILTEQHVAEAVGQQKYEEAQRLQEELPAKLADLRERMEREKQRIIDRARKAKRRK